MSSILSHMIACSDVLHRNLCLPMPARRGRIFSMRQQACYALTLGKAHKGLLGPLRTHKLVMLEQLLPSPRLRCCLDALKRIFVRFLPRRAHHDRIIDSVVQIADPHHVLEYLQHVAGAAAGEPAA